MKTISHRICYYNQNDIKQIPLSLEKNIDFFEIDVQLCKDGLVIFHDYNLEEKGVYKNITEYTINELESYNIQSLDMLLKVLNAHNGLNIMLDIKGHNEKIVGLLYKLLNGYNNTNNTKFFIQSFNHYIIDLLRKFLGCKDSTIQYGYLISGFMNIYWDTYTKNIDYVCIDNEFVAKYLSRIDKPLYIYNCNHDKELNCPKDKVIGVVTDFPNNFSISNN